MEKPLSNKQKSSRHSRHSLAHVELEVKTSASGGGVTAHREGASSDVSTDHDRAIGLGVEVNVSVTVLVGVGTSSKDGAKVHQATRRGHSTSKVESESEISTRGAGVAAHHEVSSSNVATHHDGSGSLGIKVNISVSVLVRSGTSSEDGAQVHQASSRHGRHSLAHVEVEVETSTGSVGVGAHGEVSSTNVASDHDRTLGVGVEVDVGMAILVGASVTAKDGLEVEHY